MNILIINQHANNLGDEAAGIALIERLFQFEDVEQIYLNYIGPGKLHYNHKNVVQMESSIKKIGLKNIIYKIICNKVGLNFKGNEFLEEYSNCVEASNCIFVSPSGADLGHYKGWSALLNIMLAKSYKKKIVFHLNSIDKCENVLFETMKKVCLKGLHIYVREKSNVQYLEKNGYDAKFGIDTAFMLRDCNVSKENVISLVYSEYDFMFDENKKRIIERNINEQLLKPLVNYAKKMNYKIQILPHLLVESEKKYLLDLRDKINKMEDGVAYYDELVKDAITYQEEIAKSKIIIAMRYHSIVLAAKNGIPFISLSYDSKMDELSKYLDMEKYNISLFEINAQTIEEMLVEIGEHSKEISTVMKRNIENLLNTAMNPTSIELGNLESV